jgi:hypothetical protein
MKHETVIKTKESLLLVVGTIVFFGVVAVVAFLTL